MKKTVLFLAATLCISGVAFSQKNKKQSAAAKPLNDITAPLHLLQPEYAVPYGIPTPAEIGNKLTLVFDFLDKNTPARVIDKNTGAEITDFSEPNSNAVVQQGAFRLTSYEWGVTYAGMLAAAQATGEEKYLRHLTERFRFLADRAPYFQKQLDELGTIDPQFRRLLDPKALDDAGAMCAAMAKYQVAQKPDFDLTALINNSANYIMYREMRLADGTFARNRPQHNTVWLDDMFMSIPALAQMGVLTREQRYTNEAVRQVKLFAEKMWVEEHSLFRHGWVEQSSQHPSFFWARANGWALLTLTEVLDVLPQSNPDRDFILKLYQKHVAGLAALQSGDGFWHQLLDKNDSYLETSATAIYTYCIARGINKGWIDPVAFGSVATLGWNAVATKITAQGLVEGTCVGTGMAFDPAFYYHRPVNAYAAHGYGPVLLAGAEMIVLLQKFFPRMNDSAVQFYAQLQAGNAPIFSVGGSQAGSSRKGNKPILFLIGDSTMKNGAGKGDGGQWGWGSFFEQFVDTAKITVENHALGGRSSRTFITEGLWDNVLSALRKGDYLIIQFGHNDATPPLNAGRARQTINGTGNEQQTVVMERGGTETVYTFGHYLRLYIRQAKAKGVTPIVLSPTPNNRWTDGKIYRQNQTYAKWSREVAQQEGVAFIDLNNLSADKFDQMGEEEGKKRFADSVHTTREGALLNDQTAAEGIKTLDLDLKNYLK